MDVKTFVEWLLNMDDDGAEDEDFAGFFVWLYKTWMWKTEYADPITEYDTRSFPINEFTNWMKLFPIDEFTSWLDESLNIIDDDSECCPSAWWKRHPKFSKF